MVHPKAKFPSICKPLKTDKLLSPKYNDGINIYWTFQSKREKLEGRKK